ncbi:MAG: helix-turn-helix transcriptional regulator [Saprospiraceae bacterium]|nr:helix-turn-helix transcriptional regulator [Saprospiraceae bacterium]
MMLSLFNFPHNLKKLMEEEQLEKLANFSVGEWSCYLEQEHGMSANELAEKLDIPVSHLRKLKQNNNLPDTIMLAKLLGFISE